MGIDELIDEKIKYWEKQDSKSSCYHKEAGRFIDIALSDMEQLKSSLPTQQDKVVVPEFVAEWIELCKFNATLSECLDGSYPITGQHSEIISEDEDWIITGNNEELLARAWLDGYTVEKEQFYYIEIPLPNKVNGCGRLGQSISGGLEVLYTKISLEPKWKTQFTENEIKAIDERYWAFAVPVEEEE